MTMRSMLADHHTDRASLLSLLLVLSAIGCATDESTAPASSNELTPTTPTVALSADWLNGSVTWLDLDQLVAPNGTLETNIPFYVDFQDEDGD